MTGDSAASSVNGTLLIAGCCTECVLVKQTAGGADGPSYQICSNSLAGMRAMHF